MCEGIEVKTQAATAKGRKSAWKYNKWIKLQESVVLFLYIFWYKKGFLSFFFVGRCFCPLLCPMTLWFPLFSSFFSFLMLLWLSFDFQFNKRKKRNNQRKGNKNKKKSLLPFLDFPLSNSTTRKSLGMNVNKLKC